MFQNQMQKKAGHLAKVLGPQLAQQLGGANAGANTRVINLLPPQQRGPVRVAFADSLTPMWIMYTVFAGAGLITAFFIRGKVLSAKHEETKTGLEAEKENATARQAEKEAKRASKRQGQPITPPRTPRTPHEDDEKVTDFDESSKGSPGTQKSDDIEHTT